MISASKRLVSSSTTRKLAEQASNHSGWPQTIFLLAEQHQLQNSVLPSGDQLAYALLLSTFFPSTTPPTMPLREQFAARCASFNLGDTLQDRALTNTFKASLARIRGGLLESPGRHHWRRSRTLQHSQITFLIPRDRQQTLHSVRAHTNE